MAAGFIRQKIAIEKSVHAIQKITRCKLYNKHHCSIDDLIDWAVREFACLRTVAGCGLRDAPLPRQGLQVAEGNYSYKKIADPVKDVFGIDRHPRHFDVTFSLPLIK
ncbi:hypothetical protein ON010_g14538 [Phytophthora cinnamomi]|nr:hypothetical protein ON010_g14538 [Phytophthora cinnamomi]